MRRIIVTATLAMGLAGALASRARPLHADDGVHQLWRDANGDSVCSGTCRAGCCKIIPV